MLERLDGVRPTGSGFKARCVAPDHGKERGDRNRSLSVREGVDGRVLIECHAGCPVEEIVADLGLSMGDLFPESADGQRENGRGSLGRKPTAVWQIRDAAGETYAEHIRFDRNGGKDCFWRLPGAKGRKVSSLPLYRSEQVKNWPPHLLVIVTEGEKAADALVKVYPATLGTVTGAGGTPALEALEVLRGRRVVLWADNDEPGRHHMQRIAAALQGVAEEIRDFEWDGAPEKGDAADHPAVKSRSREALRELLDAMAATPIWSSRAEDRDGRAATCGEASEEPVPLPKGLPPVVKLDPAMLPDPLRGWIMNVSERMQLPPDFVAVGALVVAGSLIGRKIGIHPKRYDDWLVISNLWGLVVGRPSLLKSPALAEAMKSLSRLIAEAYERHAADLEAYEADIVAAEAMKAALKDEVKLAAKESRKAGNRAKLDEAIAEQRNVESPKEPTVRCYKTEDATVEKLSELLLQNPQGMLVKKLDSLESKDFGATVEEEVDIPAVRFTPEAQQVFDRWREELEKNLRSGELVPALEAHLAKYRSLMPSRALHFQLVDFVDGREENGAVGQEATLRAAAWCEYLRSHAARLYSSAENPAMEAARALLKHIQKGDVEDGSTIREIYRKQWAKLSTPESVSAAVEVLEEFGWLRVETVGTRGRSTTKVHLHPSLKGDA